MSFIYSDLLPPERRSSLRARPNISYQDLGQNYDDLTPETQAGQADDSLPTDRIPMDHSGGDHALGETSPGGRVLTIPPESRGSSAPAPASAPTPPHHCRPNLIKGGVDVNKPRPVRENGLSKNYIFGALGRGQEFLQDSEELARAFREARFHRPSTDWEVAIEGVAGWGATARPLIRLSPYWRNLVNSCEYISQAAGRPPLSLAPMSYRLTIQLKESYCHWESCLVQDMVKLTWSRWQYETIDYTPMHTSLLTERGEFQQSAEAVAGFVLAIEGLADHMFMTAVTKGEQNSVLFKLRKSCSYVKKDRSTNFNTFASQHVNFRDGDTGLRFVRPPPSVGWVDSAFQPGYWHSQEQVFVHTGLLRGMLYLRAMKDMPFYCSQASGVCMHAFHFIPPSIESPLSQAA